MNVYFPGQYILMQTLPTSYHFPSVSIQRLPKTRKNQWKPFIPLSGNSRWILTSVRENAKFSGKSQGMLNLCFWTFVYMTKRNKALSLPHECTCMILIALNEILYNNDCYEWIYEFTLWMCTNMKFAVQDLWLEKYNSCE